MRARCQVPVSPLASLSVPETAYMPGASEASVRNAPEEKATTSADCAELVSA